MNNRRRKFSDFFNVGRNYKEEFRKQLRMIITFTLGLGIAFTWREYLYESSKKIVKWMFHADGQAAFGGAVFVTLISIVLIYATSLWLKEKY